MSDILMLVLMVIAGFLIGNEFGWFHWGYAEKTSHTLLGRRTSRRPEMKGQEDDGI